MSRPRLLDLVLAKWQGEERPITEPMLRGATAFLIDNVADYYYRGSDREDWGEADFPCISPPTHTMWFEYAMPTLVRRAKQGDIHDPGANRESVGFLLSSIDSYNATPRQIRAMSGMFGDSDPALIAKARWFTVGATFLGVPAAKPAPRPVCSAHFGYAVHPDGTGACLTQDRRFWFGRLTEEFIRASHPECTVANAHLFQARFNEYLCSLMGHLDPVLLALSFLHCRNVETEEARRRPRRKRQKRNRKRIPESGVRYHLLKIGPMTRRMDEASRAAGKDGCLKTALHICRGHFKDYRERGLFGNADLRGRYWWPMHARGTTARGQVKKDYQVEAGDG